MGLDACMSGPRHGPGPNARIRSRDLGSPAASFADPADLLPHADEAGPAVGAAQRLSPFMSTECERP